MLQNKNMSKYILTFADINLDGIVSQLINNFIANSDKDNDSADEKAIILKNIPLPEEFASLELVNWFNMGIVMPHNVNLIISFCDYLMLENTSNYLQKNAQFPWGFQMYKLNDYHKPHYGHIFPKTILNSSNFKSMNVAMGLGLIKIVQYLHDMNLDWDKESTLAAAEFGHLDCLKFAHENGCDWNEETCIAAAEFGHLDCLKYAHENGCDWNMMSVIYAAAKGNLDCLKYAAENGCVIDIIAARSARRNGHVNCVNYLSTLGYQTEEEIIDVLQVIRLNN